MANYNGNNALSYNGLILDVNTNRNSGKTWNYKKRAIRRALKYGKITLWLRIFKEEKREAANNFFASPDLQAFCGVSFYDKEDNPKGNIKQNGSIIYCRYRGKWQPAIKIACLSQRSSMRGIDDVRLDNIVLDEYSKPINELKRYRGNMVDDFLDIRKSVMRRHKVTCILLGNSESPCNYFRQYFGIPEIPTTYNGIRTFRKGTYIIEQRYIPLNEENETRERALLDGTAYGNFTYSNDYHQKAHIKISQPPKDANEYIQLCISGAPLRIWNNCGIFYVNNKIDTKRRNYSIFHEDIVNNTHLLTKRQKEIFTAFLSALAHNRVYYNSQQTYLQIQPFIKWLL